VQPVHQGEAKMLAWSTLDATADAIISEGIATPDQVTAALASLRPISGTVRSSRSISRRQIEQRCIAQWGPNAQLFLRDPNSASGWKCHIMQYLPGYEGKAGIADIQP
jgi:hypothetical protein